MAQLSLHQVTFYYPQQTEPLFHHLNLNLSTDWRCGLIGRNGRGKTTLLHLIDGSLSPVNGTVSVPVPVFYFPFPVLSPENDVKSIVRNAVFPFDHTQQEMETLLNTPDEPSLLRYAELEEQFRRAGGYEIDARLEKELTLMDLPPAILDRRFGTLSPGEQTRALITALFLRRGLFRLIDEPTNHLDQPGRLSLARYLAGKEGFICASHDRDFLDRCADHILSLNRNDIRINQGNFSVWSENTGRQLLHEQREKENLEREIGALQRAAGLRRKWSGNKEKEKYSPKADVVNNKGAIGHKAAKMMKSALIVEQRIDRSLEEKKELLKNRERLYKLKLTVPEHVPELPLSLHDLCLRYGEHTVVRGFYLHISRGERVALTGANGCGKSSILKAVMGEIPVAGGNIQFAPGLEISYAAQVFRWREETLGDYLAGMGLDLSHCRDILACMGLKGDILAQYPAAFSNGERRMIELCPSFAQTRHLLIWDEPMNYLDIPTRERIEQAVLEAQPTLLFVEHDRKFIDRVATGKVKISI